MDCRWSCMSKMKKTRKPGGGRKKLKPEYDAGKNLKEQMESAVALYDSEMSLQAIGDELGLNPIKVRKLLITAGVYESEVAEKVKNTFEEYYNKINLIEKETLLNDVYRQIYNCSKRCSEKFTDYNRAVCVVKWGLLFLVLFMISVIFSNSI